MAAEQRSPIAKALGAGGLTGMTIGRATRTLTGTLTCAIRLPVSRLGYLKVLKTRILHRFPVYLP